MTNENIITKDEAIDRMKAGLPCETQYRDHNWRPTFWTHFDYEPEYTKFRKPPEPRRVAREGWVSLLKDGQINLCRFPGGPIPEWAKDHPTIEFIRVREVLPGDVVLQRMTEDEVRKLAWDTCGYPPGSPDSTECVIFARALGLIGEGS